MTNEVDRCPDCRHAPHGALGFCPNFASDSDCSCSSTYTSIPTEESKSVIERIDRYTVLVNGHGITATESQEAAIRSMEPEAVRRFLLLMGKIEG